MVVGCEDLTVGHHYEWSLFSPVYAQGCCQHVVPSSRRLRHAFVCVVLITKLSVLPVRVDGMFTLTSVRLEVSRPCASCLSVASKSCCVPRFRVRRGFAPGQC